ASPIYFANEPVGKQAPRESRVRLRIYDFETGEPRTANVQVVQGDKTIAMFTATNKAQLDAPIDAEIVVTADGERPIRKNLLMDCGPIHRFLWSLESKDLADPKTFDQFEELISQVELEFPIGVKTSGCYVAKPLRSELPFESIKIMEGPKRTVDGSVAV